MAAESEVAETVGGGDLGFREDGYDYTQHLREVDPDGIGTLRQINPDGTVKIIARAQSAAGTSEPTAGARAEEVLDAELLAALNGDDEPCDDEDEEAFLDGLLGAGDKASLPQASGDLDSSVGSLKLDDGA
jgi:hypothetical protein